MLVGRAWRCNRGHRGQHGVTFCRRVEPQRSAWPEIAVENSSVADACAIRHLWDGKALAFFGCPGWAARDLNIWSAVSRRRRRGFGAWMVNSVVRRICACNGVVLAALGGLVDTSRPPVMPNAQRGAEFDHHRQKRGRWRRFISVFTSTVAGASSFVLSDCEQHRKPHLLQLAARQLQFHRNGSAARMAISVANLHRRPSADHCRSR